MNQARSMQIGNTMKQLISDIFTLNRLKLLTLLQCTTKISFHEFEDGINMFCLVKRFTEVFICV
jgi:hypothetical protein